MKKSTRILVAKDTLEKLIWEFYVNKKSKKVSLRHYQKKSEKNTRFYQSEELESLLANLVLYCTPFKK